MTATENDVAVNRLGAWYIRKPALKRDLTYLVLYFAVPVTLLLSDYTAIRLQLFWTAAPRLRCDH